jgi:phosphoglycolate phosphatase-like HAD superfamily hydrolase
MERPEGGTSMKKTVVFDFDGVIHSYISGWKGETCIPDPPVQGIDRALRALKDAGYEVVIVSTRCSTQVGVDAINLWLYQNGLAQYVDKVCKEKPPAIVYIDDRAICFDGNPDTLLEKVNEFKPWYKREG